MKIQDQDVYYGAVLQQIAEYPVFTSINRVTEKPGLYLVNDTKRMLIKYSRENGPSWTFKFTPDDLQMGEGYEYYVALNCGNRSVCMLSEWDLHKVLDANAKASQMVRVWFSDNSSIRVSGPQGQFPNTIAHNAFPASMLGRVRPEQEQYAMPPLSRLTVYNEPPQILFQSTDRMDDLADLLGGRVSSKGRTFYLGVSTVSHTWKTWNEKNLKFIEKDIQYDLGFDGYKVKIERHTPAVDPATKRKDRPCNEEFLWKLHIAEA